MPIDLKAYTGRIEHKGQLAPNLATLQALHLAHALLKATELGSRYHLIVGTHGFLAAFVHQPPPPAENQAGREPMAAGT